MENQRSVVLERLKESANVLVTVSTNPSVDQLSGAIGLTLLLNKLGKHATAVFSGDIPDTLEFLNPEKTLEKNTDSLRDFIIALDKAKADKLRYKVEDKLVKIFITPYRTSLDEEDLEFSHGDFNVDVVIALGVHEQQDLDRAISAHGRILHDATVVSVNAGEPGNLGTINWAETSVSSLCEMLVGIGEELKSDIFDAQMANAFLTGVVAETERFSNEKTSSNTMSVSAKLMAAGANQQLVATQLEEKQEPEDDKDNEAKAKDGEATASSDGSLLINHRQQKEEEDSQIHIDEHGTFRLNRDEGESSPPEETPQPEDDQENPEETPPEQPEETSAPESEPSNESGSVLPENPKFVTEPPSYLDQADNSKNEDEEPSLDPFSLPPVDSPFANHVPTTDTNPQVAKVDPPEDKPADESAPAQDNTPVSSSDEDDQTLSELEEAVNNPDIEPNEEAAKAVAEQVASDLDSARSAVSDAVTDTVSQGALEPEEGEGATPVNLDLGHDDQATQVNDEQAKPAQPHSYLDVNNLDEATGLPVGQAPEAPTTTASESPQSVVNVSAPPPVPPPMMPPDMLPPPNNSSGNQSQVST